MAGRVSKVPDWLLDSPDASPCGTPQCVQVLAAARCKRTSGISTLSADMIDQLFGSSPSSAGCASPFSPPRSYNAQNHPSSQNERCPSPVAVGGYGSDSVGHVASQLLSDYAEMEQLDSMDSQQTDTAECAPCCDDISDQDAPPEWSEDDAEQPPPIESSLTAASWDTKSQYSCKTNNKRKSVSEGGANAVGSVKTQHLLHKHVVASAFSEFTCKCSFKAPGDASCLDSFTKQQLRSFHHRTYGMTDGASCKDIEVSEVKRRIHTEVWGLKVPRTTPDPKHNRPFEVPTWKLDGRAVCKEAFQAAMGGTKHAHMEALALTLRGHPPSQATARLAASKATRELQSRRTPYSVWAVSWWKRHIMWQDWLPNEVKVQYRGPKWKVVYESFYKVDAIRVHQVLGPRQWYRMRTTALDELHATYFPNVTHCKLTLTRSARHSKFPECTRCQIKRKAYQEVASVLTSTDEEIEEKYQDMVDHARSWQRAREVCLAPFTLARAHATIACSTSLTLHCVVTGRPRSQDPRLRVEERHLLSS